MDLDEIASFRRAIRLGYRVRKLSDVTDTMLTDMILRHNDLDAARTILHECYSRSYDLELNDENQDPACRLLGKLRHGSKCSAELAKHRNIEFMLDGFEFIAKHSDDFGIKFTEYLSGCFNAAYLAYVGYWLDPDGECRDEKETPDWLGLAFNLRLAKDSGRHIDPERDAEILDGINQIFIALSAQNKWRKSKLEHDLRNYTSGNLPPSIQHLIKLNGYPHSVDFLAARKNGDTAIVLGELAQDLLKAIERANTTTNGPLRVRRMAAANMFMACQDFNVIQVESLLEQTECEGADRDALQNRREVLRGYCSESLRKNNKSGNATGFERLYRNHRDKLPDARSAPRPFYRSEKQSLELLLEYEVSEIQQAFEIVGSFGVNNQHRKILQNLKRQSPNYYERVWHRHIWPEFEASLGQTVKMRGSATTVN